MAQKIPDMNWGVVHPPASSVVQLACVYCLGEGLEAPVAGYKLYMWQGTSLCADHLKTFVGGSK